MNIVLLTSASMLALGANLQAADPTIESQYKETIAVVQTIFDTNSFYPPDHTAFSRFRQHFTVEQQQNIDNYISAYERLVETKKRIAGSLGITEAWWWPAGLDLDVHELVKYDLLTTRTSLPDEITIDQPTFKDHQIKIVVRESYRSDEQTSVKQEETKLISVIFVRENDRWKISNMIFRSDDTSSARSYSLTDVMRERALKTNRIRSQLNLLPEHPEVRKAKKA